MDGTDHGTVLNLDEFPQEGLYLIFSDTNRIAFVRDNIDRLAEEYWTDPAKIPEEVKEQAEFMPCNHCPHQGEKVLCQALKPLLPYVEGVDRYMSYDKVTAVFRSHDSAVLHVSHTTMQRALRYLAILCLMYYCEMGSRYSKYFMDVVPLMDPDEVCTKIYANICMHHIAHPEEIDPVIASLRAEVLESSECLVQRLNMICKSDAFVNAFVNTNVIVEALDFKRVR